MSTDLPANDHPPAAPPGDDAVTETLQDAVFTDAAGDTVTLSGSWTTYYDAQGAIDNNQNASLDLTATGALGTTIFSKAYAPYGTPLPDSRKVSDGYELLDNAASNGDYGSLYFDYVTETPASLAKALSGGLHSSMVDGNGNAYTLSNPGIVTSVTCFAAGTEIATPDGGAAIETLRRGDAITLADGRVARIRWVGRRSFLTAYADPLSAFPICIMAGALGEGLPRRDLFVSPCHALLVQGVLVQAGALVNNTSILRAAPRATEFTYYHLELETHALILAEGTPAESFVDNIDRMAFDNWAEHEALFGTQVTMPELDLPRAKSTRQVPPAIHAALAVVARTLREAA